MPQAIEVTTTRKRTLGIQPHVVIDDYDTGLSKRGVLRYPLEVGVHQLTASAQGVVATDMEVTVGPDQIVSVVYDVCSGLGSIKANLSIAGTRGTHEGSVAPLAKGYSESGPIPVP
jgi:hypothetical protein